MTWNGFIIFFKDLISLNINQDMTESSPYNRYIVKKCVNLCKKKKLVCLRKLHYHGFRGIYQLPILNQKLIDFVFLPK